MKMKRADVIVLGAGPVGLMLAALLGRRGIEVQVLEKRTALPPTSQAIGVTPPSLHLFDRLGLADRLIDQGVKIRDCHVHGQGGYLGCASFRQIRPPYRFILSLPQRLHMQAMEAELQAMPSVHLTKGVEVTQVMQDEKGAACRLANGETVHGCWLVGCDGHNSLVRQAVCADLPVKRETYGCHFVMGDFQDEGRLGADAHLWFTADGAVESFPLPDGLRRWIVQTGSPARCARGFIPQCVQERSGLLLRADDQMNETQFSPWRLDCPRYRNRRLILCGDAAHVMSPIGGQGMNTGWADAEFLDEALAGVQAGHYADAQVLAAYEHYRGRSARAAAARAASGMWLGTRRGVVPSLFRDFFMSQILFQAPLAAKLGPFYAMQTLPYHSLAAVPARAWAGCRAQPPTA